jgi:hypothetical protein
MPICRSLRIAFLALALLVSGPLLALAWSGHSSGHSQSYSSGSGHVNSGSHYVHGYTRKDGTTVTGHYATIPNSSRKDNYSTKGNVNPHTGKPGTRRGD